MKKILIVYLILMFIITGCDNTNKYQNELKKLVDNYYEEYILEKVDNLNTIEITLADLKDISITSKDLDNCEDDTKVIANIENKEIVSYEYKLNCR